MLLRNRGNACQIRHRQERVRRAFDKESLHIGRHLGIERFQIRCVFNGVVDSEILEDLIENAESSAIHVARNNDAVTLLKKRKHRRGCGHAACKSKASNTAFEVSDQRFESCSRGVARAGIFPTCIFAKASLLIGRSLVNGNVYSSRDLVAIDATVNEFSFNILRS